MLVGPYPGAAQIIGGSTLPSTPTFRQIFLKSGSASGLYVCLSNGTWTQLSSGSSSIPSTVQGDTLYASATNTLSALAKNTSATRYLSNTGTSNNPAWAQVDLSNGVTGDLPFANLTQASAASKLLGRGSASGAGDFEEIGLGTGLSMSGTTLSSTVAAGGSNGQVQYNNGGAFGGITGATTNGTTLTLVAPILGAATATSINGLTLTSSTGTFTLTNAKTFSVSNTLTLAGTDGSTLNVGAGGTLGSNAFTSTAYLPLTGGTLTGALLFSTDNTIDIGASGATRPRNVYIGTGAYFGTDIFVSRSGTNTFSVRNAANTGYNIFRASRFYASRDDDSLGADIGLGSVDVLRLGSAGGVSISSTANSNGSNDVAISRQGVGVLQVGTAIGNASGALYAANSKFGGTAVRGTTEGTNKVDIFDGTAPVGTLANGISLYSTAGELRVMDAAGNATLLSPHDHETNEWVFFSCNTVTGKCIRIDMEKAMRVLQAISGEKIITEWTDKPAGDASSKGKP